MDIDSSGVYDVDPEETYDTPSQVKELSSPFTQHQSTPTLPSLPIQCDQNIHNSAPNLEHNAVHCNVLFKNGNNMPANIWPENQNFDDGFYMNTSLHAESKVLSRNNSAVEIDDPSKSIIKKCISQVENVNLPNEAVTFHKEQYYMAPPLASNDELNFINTVEKDEPCQDDDFYDEPPKIDEKSEILPLEPSNNVIERVVAAKENAQAVYDEPSKSEEYQGNLPLLHPSMIRHTPITGVSTNSGINCNENSELGFYDEPSKLGSDHGSLPPLPNPLDEVHSNNYNEENNNASPIEESIYEGINDNEIGDFYEGLGDDNFYEGLENPKEFYSDGHLDSDMNDFYEGIGDANAELYEGLDDGTEGNFGLSAQEDTSLKCLIDSLGKADTPYVPPKPPPVPFRNPSKAFKPLPDIPQYQPFDPLIKYTKMSPTTEDGPCLSPVINEVAQLMFATEANSKLSSTIPPEPSMSSASSEGLYDGIDMASEDGEAEDDEYDYSCKKETKNGMTRSYSVTLIKQSVNKTRHKTAQHLENFKDTISHSLSTRRSKWKDSKARSEMKTVYKETKTKATELKANTETMYNVLHRRASKSWKKSSKRKPLKSNSGEDVAPTSNIELETSTELEEPLSPSEEFKSFATENVASSAGSKYYDLEASGGSDQRSSLTSESQGVVGAVGRVRSNNSAMSSTYHGDISLTPSSSGMMGAGHLQVMGAGHPDNSMVVVIDPPARSHDQSTQEDVDNGAAAINGAGSVGLVDQNNGGIAIPPEVVGGPGAAAVNSHVSYMVTDRHKVLQQILDHEYRYIMSLKDMMKVYAAPLQHSQANKSLIEPAKAQEIFFRIPEITVHHEFFYEQLRRRSMTWSKHQSLGDILLQLFHKPGLFSAYASYMDNFNHALEIVLDARAARPAFSKLLDKLRSKSNQLSLEDLIYLPVDHIPVYLELLQELIKQTTQDDPDYTYLYLAKDEISKLIEKLNERKQQAEKSFSVKVLEKKISGMPCSLIAPQRYIISVERVRELDILTERSDDRIIVILSDMMLCLKPLTRTVSTNVISTGASPEYQYLWDSLITDIQLNIESEPVKPVAEETSEDQDGYQALKDDLMIIEQIDALRKQLKSSYTCVRFDKLADIQARLRKEIAGRQSSEESRRGKTLKVTRPVNSPCTSTQFHQFLFSTVAKRSQWCDAFLQRQQLMRKYLEHTKGLDWCQVGETEVVSQERLATLLPIIRHMTPIGLTTPSFFSVECAAANADFTCPVTQDILYRIMSRGEEQYENASDPEEIPILPPGQAAPLQDTPLYEEELTLPHLTPVTTSPHVDHQPANYVTSQLSHVTSPQSSSHVPPLPVINPLDQQEPPRRPSVPSVITSRSPFAVTSSVIPPPLPGRSFSIDASAISSNPLLSDGGPRSHSFDSAVQEMMSPPPLPGNHPLIESSSSRPPDVHRHTIIEMIESVPKEFNIDARETVEDLYETPYEISLLREEKRKLMSLSVDGNLMETSLREVNGSSEDVELGHISQQTDKQTHGQQSDTQTHGQQNNNVVIEEELSQPDFSLESDLIPEGGTQGDTSLEGGTQGDTSLEGGSPLQRGTSDEDSDESLDTEHLRPRVDTIDMSSLDYPSLPSVHVEEAPQSLQPHDVLLTSLQSLPDDGEMPQSALEFATPPTDHAAGGSGLLKPLNKFENMNLSEFPDDSFNLELTESRALSSFIAPKKDSMASSKSDPPSGAPLLVDKYGQVYTDKITSLISGPGTLNMTTEVPLPDLDKKSVDLSLIELESEDEDDTPNMYDSQLNLLAPSTIQESMNTTLTTPHNSIPHHSHNTSNTFSAGSATPLNNNSLNTSNSSDTPPTPAQLPNIVVPTSELEIVPPEKSTDNLYENVASTTQQLRTKVIRRESSKRSLTRGPNAADSRVSLVSENWLEQDPYENLNEDTGEFELKSTDVFLCGHGQNGTGEIVVLRLSEPTPHIALNIPLKSSQVLSCHMVPGSKNTLWVGTQDARLLVYQMDDPSSSLLELDLEGGSVICISHIEDSVFVGTSEGVLHVFTRDASVNEWCENDPISKKLGNSSICAMLPIGDHMWCSCGSQIFVISPRNVTVEHLFSTHNNTSAQVYKMVNSGSGVWLAIRNSPVIRLFHAKTGEHLEDYDISTVVHHLFTGALSAAQRRRAENVRVTALLASASTGALWIGTSSGVIVVVPICKPPVAPKVCGPPFLSYMGHYDGVRFLMQAQSRVKKFIAAESNEQETVFEEITSQVVISCGKGMEDFRDLENNSTQGKILDDSQNSSYLVVWHYPGFDEST